MIISRLISGHDDGSEGKTVLDRARGCGKGGGKGKVILGPRLEGLLLTREGFLEEMMLELGPEQ